MSNNRTGQDYLDYTQPKKKKTKTSYAKAHHQKAPQRQFTEAGYMSPDGTFHPGLKPQYQEPPKRRSATAVQRKKKKK